MKYKELIECTHPQSPQCVYMRQYEVEKAFLSIDVVAPVHLMHVIDVMGRRHLLWCSKSRTGKTETLPVFTDELNNEVVKAKEYYEVKEYDFIYKNQMAYLFHKTKDGRFNVRLLLVYRYQSLVRSLMLAQGEEPKDFYIVRLVNWSTGHIFGYCWRIFTADEYGDEVSNLLPIDLRNVCWMNETILQNADIEAVKVGESVTANNVRYVVKKDKQGLYLQKSHLQISLPRRFKR